MIEPGLSLVQLRLDLGEAEHDSWRARLLTAPGEEPAVSKGLKVESTAPGDFAVVKLTSDLLRRGDCTVQLGGILQDGAESSSTTATSPRFAEPSGIPPQGAARNRRRSCYRQCGESDARI